MTYTYIYFCTQCIHDRINLYYLSLEKEYFLTAGNELCSDTGAIAVYDLPTCMKAAENLKQKFNTTVAEADLPGGCYMSGLVEFNHKNGSSSYAARQMCNRRGKR